MKHPLKATQKIQKPTILGEKRSSMQMSRSRPAMMERFLKVRV